MSFPRYERFPLIVIIVNRKVVSYRFTVDERHLVKNLCVITRREAQEQSPTFDSAFRQQFCVRFDEMVKMGKTGNYYQPVLLIYNASFIIGVIVRQYFDSTGAGQLFLRKKKFLDLQHSAGQLNHIIEQVHKQTIHELCLANIGLLEECMGQTTHELCLADIGLLKDCMSQTGGLNLRAKIAYYHGILPWTDGNRAGVTSLKKIRAITSRLTQRFMSVLNNCLLNTRTRNEIFASIPFHSFSREDAMRLRKLKRMRFASASRNYEAKCNEAMMARLGLRYFEEKQHVEENHLEEEKCLEMKRRTHLKFRASCCVDIFGAGPPKLSTIGSVFHLVKKLRFNYLICF